jgi:phage-related minor tail protein
MSLSADTLALGGYASGGYTGMGDRLELAGIVHKGEFVVTK